MISNFFTGRKYKILLIVISFILSAFFIYLYIKYSFHVSLNSDVVQGALEVSSILHGNILLHGWTLSPDNFLLSDLPLYLFLGIFIKNKVLLSHVAPIIIYLGLICVSLLISLRNVSHRKIALLSTFAVIGMLPLFTFVSFLVGFVHIGSILEGLCSLYLFINFIDYKKTKYLLWSGVLLLSALFSDPFIIWILLIPLIIFLIIKIKESIKNRGFLSIYTSTLIFILSIFVLSEILRYVIPRIAGFSIQKLAYQFATLPEVIAHITTIINNLLYVFGANFLGQLLFSHQAFEAILHFSVLCLILFFAYMTLKGGSKKMDSINYILSMGICLDMVAFIFSNIAANDTSSSRYLFPIIIFGAIILGRSIGNIKHIKGYVYIVALIVFLIFSAVFFRDSYLNQSDYLSLSNVKVAKFLVDHNLKYGYGYYWNSSIVTVDSNSKVKVRAIVPNGDHFVPYFWISSSAWYFHHYANFIVYDEDSSIFGQIATQAFGKPINVYHLGEDTILVWNKDITPYI